MPRQQYSGELKIATMRELDAGKSMAHVAREYQLSPKRLEMWKSEWRAKGEQAFLRRWVIGHLLMTPPYPVHTPTADIWHANASGFVLSTKSRERARWSWSSRML